MENMGIMSLLMSQTINNKIQKVETSASRKIWGKQNKARGIQCYGCEGFGHIKAKCPDFLRK